jgi:hypothetical protein
MILQEYGSQAMEDFEKQPLGASRGWRGKADDVYVWGDFRSIGYPSGILRGILLKLNDNDRRRIDGFSKDHKFCADIFNNSVEITY